jgi:hypothetical protein
MSLDGSSRLFVPPVLVFGKGSVRRFCDWRSVAPLLIAVLLSACGGGGGGGATTAAPSPPLSIISTSPANGATGVALNASISVTASRTLSSASIVSNSALSVAIVGGAPVGGSIVVVGDTATFTPFADLDPGTQYFVMITTSATDSAGVALTANFSWSFTTVSAPAAPTIGTAAATGVVTSPGVSGQATVAFTPPANNGGAAISGFTATSNPSGITATGATSPITVDGLVDGTPYTFTVTATNVAGVGPPSAASNSVTPGLGAAAPGAPTGVTVLGPPVGDSQATVSFVAPAFVGSSAITSFTVNAFIGGVPTAISASGGASPITVPGLTNGTAYTFTVTAFNAAGPGLPSAPSAPATPAGSPGAPTGVSATASAPPGSVVGQTVGQATVTFSAPASNGGSPITGFTVTSNPGGPGIVDSNAGSAGLSHVITGLSVGTPYTFTVVATNGVPLSSAPSAPSNSVTPTPAATVPSAPAAPTAAGGNAQATVTFAPPASNGGSAITSFTVTSTPDGITASGGASPIVVPGLTNGTPYTFTVAAFNGVGAGPASAASNSVTPATVPGVPVSPAANAGNGQATVTFAPPASNGGSAITSFTVTSTPGGITASGSASPIVVPGLTNGIAHTFTVTASNIVGTGNPSIATNSVTPTAGSVPGSPTGVTAVPGPARATVSFTPPASNGGSAITSFTVTSTPDGITASGAASPIVVNGLTNGTAYVFTVTATNSVGTGPASVASSPVVPATLPGAPLAVSGTGGDGQATVSFAPPASNGGSAILFFTVTSSSGVTAFGPASPIIVPGLANGVAVTFTVRATTAVGVGPDSAASNSVTPNPVFTVPSAPTAASATAANAQATVTFSAPASDGGSPITGYTVTSSPSSITASSVGAVPPPAGIVVPGLVNGTTYTFTVTANNAVGASPGSGATNAATPAGPPGAPTAVSAIGGDALATVSFTPPASNGGAAITSFQVTSCTLPGPVCVAGPTGTGSPIVVSPLVNGTAHTFTVTATNAGAQPAPPGVPLTGPASAPSNSATPNVATTVPSAPTAAVATRGNAQAAVTFSAPASDGGSAILGYTATSSPSGITASSVGALPPPAGIVVPGLVNGTAYTFTVTANNAVGTGPASGASNSVTPATVPAQPAPPSAIAGNAQATVSFTPPADGGSAIINFTVTASPGGATAFGPASPIVVTGLANDVATTFTVAATNDVGTGATSASSVAVTPSSATVPDAPTAVNAVAGNAQATVTFTAGANNGSAILGYTATSSPDGITASSVGALPPPAGIVVPGLVNGTTYTFTVTANNAVGISPSSAASNGATPAGVPGQPSAVNAVAGNAQATISFTAPANNGSPITSFTVTSSPDNLTGTGATSPIVVAGLTNGTPYTFTVRATNAVGTGTPSAASNSVIPTASATACSPTVPVVSGSVSLRAQATRATGVSPLSVFFDASATTSTATTKPFHEIEYRWNFGDAASGFWATGARAGVSSRNLAMGPIAAHVFEPAAFVAGSTTRTVTVTAFDGVSTASCSMDIIITDPEVAFAGSTLCASSTGNFAGCPAGATQVTNASWDNIFNVVAGRGQTFKRVLLARGDSFTTTTGADVRFSGPGHIGAYGAGNRPILTGPTNKLFLGHSSNLTFGDWRITDLDIDGVNRTVGTHGIQATGPASRITVLRTRIRNMRVTALADLQTLDAVNGAAQNAPVYPEWTIADSDFDANQAGMLIAMTSFAYMGNVTTNLVSLHSLRMIFGQKLVISNSEMSGTAGGTALSVRGVDVNVGARPASGTFGNAFTVPAGTFTEKVVMSDNKLLAGGAALPFSVHAVNVTGDVRFRDILVERNWLVSGPNSTNFFNSEASLITVRNNLFDMSGLAAGETFAIGLQQNANPTQMDSIAVYNNSAFTSLAAATFNGFNILIVPGGISPTNVVAINNLGYAPNNTANPTASVRNLGGGSVTDLNNSTKAQIQGVSPLFTATPPTQPSHWRPTGASYAIGGGRAQGLAPAGVPVYSDFFTDCIPDCNSVRTGNHMGAVNP